ncbi:hypothetical protein L6452_09425 [Arctium lappa]|uniref:Uncharacterized protein n=1 Tax=Arctium lappa TaxID=4217 RepID=A0ACB9DKI3_ARCLA|nr:hypothetical protein L6452_09425 [Arctium lappa]
MVVVVSPPAGGKEGTKVEEMDRSVVGGDKRRLLGDSFEKIEERRVVREDYLLLHRKTGSGSGMSRASRGRRC